MQDTNTVFISGPITKVLHTNYKEKFKKAEDELAKKGYVVINPSFQNVGFEYEDYLIITLNMLARCKAIYMLKDWQDSKGANFELAYAELAGKEVLYEEGAYVKFSKKDV